MFEWSRGKNSSNINDDINNSSGLVNSVNNVDLLAEEKSSLRLIVDTLNNTLDYKYAKRRPKDNNNNSNNNNNNNSGSLSRNSGVIATDVEMVELLGMLPRVLQGAIAPAVMKEKEEQRELMAIYNVPRFPPFSQYTILYRLLFSPLFLISSSASSLDMTSSLSLSLPSTSESDVLNCIARVLIYNCGLSTRESSVLLRQSKLHQIITDERDTSTIGDSITIASLHSLSDILHLCLNNNNNEEKEERGVCMTQMLLRDALRHALSDSGLYEYLWRSLLFHPIPDVLREVMGHILSVLSHSNILRLPAVMTATRQSISPAVWGERIAQCILSDPSLSVKESLITILHEGLVESISVNNNNKSSNFIHWKRWMTNTSFRYLLSVLATGTPVSVLRPLLAILTLALEVELQNDERSLQRSVGPMLERFHLVTVVEVCTTKLVSVFTGPNAVNRRIWTGKDEEELIYYRLLVGGLVQLLRLALKGVDVLLLLFLGRLNNNNNNNNNNHRSGMNTRISTDIAVKEATLVLRTCVEKQLVAVLLKCLEEQYQQQQQEEEKGKKEKHQQQVSLSLSLSPVIRIHTFSTGKMRAEMIRLLRDLIERATPPLFFLMGKFTPYFPMMMQSILSGTEKAEFSPSHGCKQQQEQEKEVKLYKRVCSENVEMVTLLAVLLCYSSEMRICFLETLAALQCTWEECHALFDVLEATSQLLPVYAVEELLVIDITGTIINTRENILQQQSRSVESIFYHQEEEEEKREEESWNSKKRGNDHRRNSEACWVSIQQQRRKLTAQNSHFTCALVHLILHHLRRSIMKEMSGGNDDSSSSSGIKHRKEEKVKVKEEEEKEKEEADGVSLSPIQPSMSVSTGSTRIAIVSNTYEDEIAVEDDLKKNISNRKGGICEEICMTPHSNIVEKWKHQEVKENDLYNDGRENTYDPHSIDYTDSSISTSQQEEEEWQVERKTRLVMVPSLVDLNINEMLRRVRYHQMETTAVEEKTYHAALDLFAILGSRYYRHALTPQAAVEYVKRHEHKGWTPQYHNKTFTTEMSNTIKSIAAGRRNYNTILRLWTGQDVRKEDLFFFSLPIKEINEETIIALISRCKKHQEKLRRVLRITPQAPRGRRWFLEDAATNIMGRLIALFNILLLSIQQEGEKAVQEAFTRMPEVCDKEMVLNAVGVNHMCTGDVWQKELHCGTVVDMTKFIVSCFSLPVELTV